MKWGEVAGAGFTGIGSTLLLALLWAPSAPLDALSPAAQRIFWHAPAAWAAFIVRRPVHRFSRVVVRRSNGRGGSMLQIRAGLATGLMTVV